jgi:hypothetical protein
MDLIILWYKQHRKHLRAHIAASFCNTTRVRCRADNFMILRYNVTTFFMFIWPYIVINSFWIKPTDVQFQMYFVNTTLHVSSSLPAHHQELPTVQPALAHFMQIWRSLAGWGWNWRSILTLQARGRQTCIKCANAGCTVDNSRWWAGRLLETCGVVLTKYVWNCATVGFIQKECNNLLHRTTQ